MATLAVLALLEAWMWRLSKGALLGPDTSVAVSTVLLFMVALAAWGDVRRGFVGRVGVMLALAWVPLGLGNWLPVIDRLYGDVGGGTTGTFLGVALLIAAPFGTLASAGLAPFRHREGE